MKIREFIKNKTLYLQVFPEIVIERAANRVKVTIHTAKPGMVIGRGGAEIEDFKKQLETITGKN